MSIEDSAAAACALAAVVETEEATSSPVTRHNKLGKKFTDFHKIQMPEHSCLVTEILDSRTRSVATVARVNDYVASNEIISMLLVRFLCVPNVADDKH